MDHAIIYCELLRGGASQTEGNEPLLVITSCLARADACLNFKCSGIFFLVGRQGFPRSANICTGLQFRSPLPTFGKSSKSVVRAWRSSSSLAIQLYTFTHIQVLSVSRRSIPTHPYGKTSACSSEWLCSFNMSTTERISWRLGGVLK